MNYLEVIVDYTTLVGSFTFGFSNDAFAADETGIRYEYSNGFDISKKLNLNFMLGYYDLDDVFGKSYSYYNAGLNYPISSFNFNLSYNGTTSQGTDLFGAAADDKIVATVSFDF